MLAREAPTFEDMPDPLKREVELPFARAGATAGAGADTGAGGGSESGELTGVLRPLLVVPLFAGA
jgi:hypothetical protein